MRLFLALFISIFFGFSNLFGQDCLSSYQSLENRVEQSDNILIGEIINTNSFWKGQLIMTQFEVKPEFSFKGNESNSILLEVQGGQVGLEKLHVSPGFQPIIGEKVLLFLDGDNKLSNGFLSINYIRDSEQASNELIQLNQLTGSNYSIAQKPSATAKTAAPSINSFSPISVSAGTGQTLTISGSGFGASRGNGYVEFKNANDGGNTWVRPLAAEYVSWSDSEIKVKVTAASGGGANNGTAGTGKIRVVDNSGSTATSDNDLTVRFSRLNVVSDGEPFQTKHINQNNNGGYTFVYHPSFPTDAKNAFESKLNDWRCGVLVNFGIGQSTSTAKPARDGENIIRFSDANEMPQGVLGVTYSWWAGCLTGQWFVEEIDMMYNVDRAFYFGEGATPNGQYDFRTVVLHEIGHAVQLGHVISSNESMHFSVAPGQSKRSLSERDKEGGEFVMNQSSTTNSCSQGTMTLLSANNCNLGAASQGGLAKADKNSVTVGGSTTIRLSDFVGNIQWQQSGTGDNYSDISGAVEQDYSTGALFQTTWYRAKVKNGTSQEAFSNEVKVTVGLTSIGEKKFVSNIYPNPVNTTLNLEISKPGGYQITVTDILGRTALKADVNLTTLYSLDVSNISSGVYFLHLKNQENESQSIKIIKQ